jgi:hypothetical protein
MRGLIVSTLMLLIATSQALAEEPLQPWTEIGNLPPHMLDYHMVATGDYWYAMEGDDPGAGYLGTVYSEFQPDGTIGPWLSTSDRRIDRSNYRVAAAGNRIYIVGGMSDAAPLTPALTTEYASINADGSLSAWQTSSNLSAGRMGLGLATYGDYVYAVGGHDSSATPLSSVEYAKIQADGSLGSWQSATSTQTAHPYTSVIAKNDYLYVFGGEVNAFGTNTVERAQIMGDGSLGAWVYDTSLPQDRGSMGVAVLDDTVYLLAGVSGPYGATHLSSVIWSNIQPDHTLSQWQDTEPLIPAGYYHGDSWGRHIYAVSGSGSGLVQTTVPVPEPSSVTLFLIGAVSLLAYAWRRRRQAT